MYMCVRDINYSSISTILEWNFGTVPTELYDLFFLFPLVIVWYILLRLYGSLISSNISYTSYNSLS